MTKHHTPPLPRKTVSIQMGTANALDELRNTGSQYSGALSYDCVIRDLLRGTDTLRRKYLCEDWLKHGHQMALETLLIALDKEWNEKYSEFKHPLSPNNGDVEHINP